ncbi:FecCD family ABC transporter permease [Vibrio sp. HN007]|uniref:FecCD family ABC transporter permease n=1 Tax=Vibrio iocasae TaxID=3098914 RepID=UPI0035D5134E
MRTHISILAVALLLLTGVALAVTPEIIESGKHFFNDGTYHPFWSLTAPRLVLALMAGAMLSCSGYILQTALKNPLADSGVLGINAGASLGAVCALLLPNWFGWQIDTNKSLILFSMCGGLISTVPVLLSSLKGNLSLTLLTGVAVTAILSALSSALIFTIGQGRIDLALQWMAGGLYGRGWEHVSYIFPCFVFSFVFIAFAYLPLKWVSYEDSILRGVGLKGTSLRLLLLTGSTLITASAVSMVGPIGFIGLIIPHAARLLCNHQTGSSLSLTILLGGLFLTFSDHLSRSLLYPTEVPAGVVTALIGVPFFLMLLRRHT